MTYALLALAAINTFSMWKLARRIWETMTEGRNTPDDAKDAPKIAPAIVVGNIFEDILGGKGSVLEAKLHS